MFQRPYLCPFVFICMVRAEFQLHSSLSYLLWFHVATNMLDDVKLLTFCTGTVVAKIEYPFISITRYFDILFMDVYCVCSDRNSNKNIK